MLTHANKVSSTCTGRQLRTPPHFEYVILLQSKVTRSQLDAFTRLRLDRVNALMVVAVVTRVVG